MKRQLDTTQKLYTLCMLVQDVPGVLSQVARLFSRKGYNIESIVSGDTDKPGITRITIAIMADQGMLEQIAAQCSKLIPVISVKILDESVSIRREVALIKVDAADHAKRNEIIGVIEQLPEASYDILHKIYIQGMTLDEVAYARDKSRSWAASLHGTALKHLQDILDNVEKC